MIDAYKGVRDFYPEDERVQNYIFGAMRRAAESFGYEEMNASILEATELYTAKSSEEIVREQTYTFLDRGNRSVTLRPEMTPTVARMVAAKRRGLAWPLRWYSIQNFFRYERPQRGRGREFWQLNADLFGVEGLEADVEVISLAYRVMEEFGADDNMFSIRVGSRKVLDAATKATGMTKDDVKRYRAILDAKRKMEPAEYDKAVAEVTKVDPLHIIGRGGDESVAEAMETVTKLLASLEKIGVVAVHDPSVVRGFEYYTDIVFEVFDTDPANSRSLFGGGRYDNLIEQYGDEHIPAVGFAMGDIVAFDFLMTHGLLPELPPTTRLYLAPVTESDRDGAVSLASELRMQGINVGVGMKHEKVADHVKAAVKHGIPYFIAYGEKERSSGCVTVKTLSDGSEKSLALSALSDYLIADR